MAHDELRRELDALDDLLTEVHEDWWASWARRMSERLADGCDPAEVRAAFGGMGSLNDLVIHPVNGHVVEEDSIDTVNARLRAAQSRIFELSNAR